MKKKWIALGLAVALVFEGSVSYAAELQNTTRAVPEEFEVVVQEEKINGNQIEGTTIYWNEENGILTLSTSGNGTAIPDYSIENSAPWYGKRNSIKEVIIQPGISSIGEYAFYDMAALQKVRVNSNTLTSIGSYAFDSCKKLKEINLPDTINDLGIYAFARCTNLTKISEQGFVTPIGLTEIPEFAFAQCSSISKAIISENVEKIDMCAFYGCGGLKSVDFAGEDLKVIEDYAFSKSGLESIAIPSKIQKIQEYAFADCNSLQRFGIKEVSALTEIGTGAFDNCQITKFYTMDSGYAYDYAAENFKDAHQTYRYMSNDVKGNYEIEISGSATYTGQAVEPKVKITYILAGERMQLQQNEDYTLTYKNNINVGNNATITIQGVNGYYGSMDTTFTIEPLDISNRAKATVEKQVYTGEMVSPAVEVILDGNVLEKDIDYVVSYVDNIQAGNQAKVVIAGRGNYRGTLVTNFTIVPYNFSDNAEVSEIANQNYTGKAIEPAVKVTLKGKTLKKDVDYIVKYANNVNVGSNAKVIITGMGNYTGVVEKKFIITTDPKGNPVKPVNLSKADITVKKQSYTGKKIKAKVTVKVKGVTLKEGNDYKVSYSNNKNIGKKAKVTIKGIGSYTGSVTKNFTIAPPKPNVKVKDKKLTIGNYISGADVYISYTATSGNVKKTGKLLWQSKKYKSKKCVDLSQLVKKYKGYNIKVRVTMKAKSVESAASKQVTVK